MNIKVDNLDMIITELDTKFPNYLESMGINPFGKFKCINPNHNETNPSCSIVPKNDSIAHCFGCGETFNIFKAAHFLEGFPSYGPNFIQENVLKLAERFNIEVNFKEPSPEEIYRADTYRSYKEASTLIAFHEIQNNKVLEEIKRRGWEIPRLRKYMIGSIKNFKWFIESLESLGFNRKFLNEVDLARSDIFNENNLIFTICDEIGRPVGFSARRISGDGSKYINQRCGDLKCNIYRKNERLYNIHLAKESRELYIFEGYPDVTTASHFGIENSVCIGGTNFSESQMFLLENLKIKDIILCYDEDPPGQERLFKLLTGDQLGKYGFNISVINLPNGHDPDSYIREYGSQMFLNLPKIKRFRWILNQNKSVYKEDNQGLCESMIPFILEEFSNLKRESLCKILADETQYRLRTILSEVERFSSLKESEKNKKKNYIIERAVREVQAKPEEAIQILSESINTLNDVEKQFDFEKLSGKSYESQILIYKNKEEAKDPNKRDGFRLGEQFKELDRVLEGEWKSDCLFIVGGTENSGKSSFLSQMCKTILENNSNSMAFFHTIDDSLGQFNPRMLLGMVNTEKDFNMNFRQLTHPNLYIKNNTRMVTIRNQAYEKLVDLVRNERFVAKDAIDGTNLQYAEQVIRYYRSLYPERDFVYFLDNFHNLQDNMDKYDERKRNKVNIDRLKKLASTYRMAVICTMEYPKIKNPFEKPTNHYLAETVASAYRANIIIHLHNEYDRTPMLSEQYIEDMGAPRPVVEFIIGKIKHNTFKGSLFYVLYKEYNIFKYINVSQMKKIIGERNLEDVEAEQIVIE